MRALFSAKQAMSEAHVVLSRLWMEGWSFANGNGAKAALREKAQGAIRLLVSAQEEVKAEIERGMPYAKAAKSKKAKAKKGKR